MQWFPTFDQYCSTSQPRWLKVPFCSQRCQVAKMKACDWVVYAKRPFAGPQQVLDYAGRYTHRVAISNNRLLDIEGDQVQFKWKDYRNGDQVKAMTLSADEFIRRFLTRRSRNQTSEAMMPEWPSSC